MIIPSLVFTIFLTLCVTIDADHIHRPGKYYRNGDFVIVGMFDSLHNEECEGTDYRGLVTLHRIEAMIFAINEVNKRSDILQNITLGYDIIDTCRSWTTAMSHAMSQIIKYEQCNKQDSNQKLVGVIGAEWSSITTKICPLYGALHLPTVSVLSSSDELSDTDNFPYFLRLAPPDKYQIKAIIDLVEYFRWSSVSFVYTDDSYGRNALKSFKNSVHNICIAVERGVDSNTNESSYSSMVNEILSHDNSRVVILFTHEPYAKKFLQAMVDVDASGKLQIIGSDDVASGVESIKPYLNVTLGMLKIDFLAEPVREFQLYFNGVIGKSTSSSNPWLEEFANETKLLEATEEVAVSNYMDSVLAFAYGLQTLIDHECHESNAECLGHLKETFNGIQLYEFIKGQNFLGYGKYNVSFGDGVAAYYVVNLQCEDNTCLFAHIGTWNRVRGLNVNNSNISWGVQDIGHSPFLSYCQEPPHNIKWNSVPAIILSSLSSIGLLSTIVVAFGYAINIRHDLIQTSGPATSFLMLSGVLLSYLIVFAFIAKPAVVSCYLTRIGYMMCFTTVIAPLLVHANTIYRRYRAAKHGTRRPNCTGQNVEIVVSLSLIIVQICITVAFLFASPPHSEITEPIPRQRELSCSKNNMELATSLTYNVFLIIACSVHAFLTRNVPENYNEFRFIGFSVYTTLVIWLLFITAYFKVPLAESKVIVLSAAMIINASIVLLFQFVMKLYAIVYVTDLNISLRKQPADFVETSSPSDATRLREQSEQIGPRVVVIHVLSEGPRQINTRYRGSNNAPVVPGSQITSADVHLSESLKSDNPFRSFISTWL